MGTRVHNLKLFGFSVKRRIWIISLAIFFGALAYSFKSTIWAVYLQSYISSDAIIGFIDSGFFVLSFFSYFFIIPVIEKYNKLKLAMISTFLVGVCYFLFAFFNNLYLVILFTSILMIIITVRTSSIGLLLKDNSSRRELSKNEGFAYTLLDFAYVIGPLIVGVIMFYFNIRFVFVILSLIFILSSLIFRFSRLRVSRARKKIDSHFCRNFLDFFKDKDRFKAYLFGGGVNFWWSLIYLYIPLLIIKNVESFYVGIFLSLVCIPLILLEYYFGELAGRKGYKKIFFLGFFIPSLIAFSCFLFFNFWFIFVVLILASFALAMIESTTESYFIDLLRGKEDQRFYPPYNTAIDVGIVFGQVFSALVLLFFDFRYIFLVYGFGMLFLSILSLKMKDVYESRRKS